MRRACSNHSSDAEQQAGRLMTWLCNDLRFALRRACTRASPRSAICAVTGVHAATPNSKCDGHSSKRDSSTCRDVAYYCRVIAGSVQGGGGRRGGSPLILFALALYSNFLYMSHELKISRVSSGQALIDLDQSPVYLCLRLELTFKVSHSGPITPHPMLTACRDSEDHHHHEEGCDADGDKDGTPRGGRK